jgi:hypothetical protein
MSDDIPGIRVQSPYLYLQAAGSDGTDGSTRGIHLRWDFLRSLGDSHLSKGNYAAGPGAPYPAPYGFNKVSDFVWIARAYYVPFPYVVNFTTDHPTSVVESGAQRAWKFKAPVAGMPSHFGEVVIRFDDLAQYDSLRVDIDPALSPYNFLLHYTGVVEAEVTGELSFNMSFVARTFQAEEGQLRVEAVSVSENLPNAPLVISCRKIVPITRKTTSAGNAPSSICAENVRYFRFEYVRCPIVELRLETYTQFIASTDSHENTWQLVGDAFALSISDSDVYNRLDNAAWQVHGKWPRYAGADPISGAFTVNAQNYKSKWDPTLPPSSESTSANGLRQGVIEYLSRSMVATNPGANATLGADNGGDQAAFDISYLSMLKLLADTDFNVARMLGLGFIDIPPEYTSTPWPYVYVAIYQTLEALEPGEPAQPNLHLYMTLRTSRQDQRLPPVPVQLAPTFGLSFDNGTNSPTLITDANGYMPDEDARMINLNVQPYEGSQAFGPFFVPPTPFCTCDVTAPVVYGFKYRLTSASSYRIPEVNNDPEFLDPSGAAEVVPLLPGAAAGGALTFQQLETEAGSHEYRFYDVNWFSRHSQLGNAQTVVIQFPQRNNLLPPSNLNVLFVQPEDPLLLTTPLEQQTLAGLTGDTTFVRCTFEWNENHYAPQNFSTSNTYADKVHLFFRQAPPRAVQGEIKSVTNVSNSIVEVRTQSYRITSTSPSQTISPAVVPGDEGRFVGSTFASAQMLYVVDSVAQSGVSGEGAIFRVRKQINMGVVDLDNNNQQSITTQTISPSAGDRFLVVENLTETNNWAPEGKLAKEVTLINFLDGNQLYTETVNYPEGPKAVNVGGIHAVAGVNDITDQTLDAQGQLITEPTTGYFTVAFLSYQLASHPDPDVDWYRGAIRIKAAAAPNKMRVLQVVKIDRTGSNLSLVVYDSTFDVDANYIPQNGYDPIQTGATVDVVFHPGYRVYLRAQAGLLDQASTLPVVPQTVKQTLLAARASNGALGVLSNLTVPVTMQARRLDPPRKPATPAGPLFATRPDYQGTSTWTMDFAVDLSGGHEPYSMIFYRANDRGILDALYQPATVAAIEAALEALSDDDAAFAVNRWSDLANVRNPHTDFGFNDYPPGVYRFPRPDNPNYTIPGTAIHPFNGTNFPMDPSLSFAVPNAPPVLMQDAVKDANARAFVPLTQTPVVYGFLNTGTQTSSRKPTIRDANGDRLLPNNPQFDPSPMAVKYAANGVTMVRFTDYTLGGASKNTYFYRAAEMSEQMRLGTSSDIAGPIALVNAYPAEAPVLRAAVTILEDFDAGTSTGVKLTVNPYVASEGITKFNLYRATNEADTSTIRAMTLVGSFDAAAGDQTDLLDNFADLDFPPFGDPLFYRVVAMRKIVNERGEEELIPSQPSSIARASIVDVENPIAPPLLFMSDPPTTSIPVKLTNCTLSWSKAANNATYRLCNQDASGNWICIYIVKSNADHLNVALADTSVGTGTLAKQDDRGKALAHRFQLKVENASGLFNLNEEVLTVPATCREGLAILDVVVGFSDNNLPAAPLVSQLCDPTVSPFPGALNFSDMIAFLPVAHVYDRTEIAVFDGLGHVARKTISTAGGAVSFQNGDGSGLVLDSSVSNVQYKVTATVFTDSCQNGMPLTYTLRYGPDVSLIGLTNVVSFADSSSIAAALSETFAPSSNLQFPTVITITDISVLPAGHTFMQMDVSVRDDLGNGIAKSISTAGGAVTFNQGDGGLMLDGSSPGRLYRISIRLTTNLSPAGVVFDYSAAYG